MDLFTCAFALGLALNPISEGYIEYSTAANKQEYVCYANLKDYQNVLFNAGASFGFFNEILYASGDFTLNADYQHITYNAGVQYKFKDFVPYFELCGTYLNEEKNPYKSEVCNINGFYEKELSLKLGVKVDHQLIKNINFYGDFNISYEFINELGLDIERCDPVTKVWKDNSMNCDYLEDMFRANIKVGARFFNVFSIYAGIQSWQTIGYSEDTGSIFGGSTPCMIRNDIGCEFKTNFKRYNPFVSISYFCQHPEKPYDYYNKDNHSSDYLTEQFNYNHMEIKAGLEIKF